MFCFNEECGKEINENSILLNEDGDYVCSEECKQKYEKEKTYFFENIVHNEHECQAFILGLRRCM